MEKAQGFEITEYGEEHEIPGRVQGSILEIIKERIQENPGVNIGVTFTANLMRLTYRSYEQGLPSKMQEVERYSKMALDETVKTLKKEFKTRNSETLDLKEVKEMANYDVQKVNLNERYVFTCWRFYEIG